MLCNRISKINLEQEKMNIFDTIGRKILHISSKHKTEGMQLPNHPRFRYMHVDVTFPSLKSIFGKVKLLVCFTCFFMPRYQKIRGILFYCCPSVCLHKLNLKTEHFPTTPKLI